MCIDVKGARVVCKKRPSTITIFIKTPTWDILKSRLKNRSSDSEQAVNLRLETARLELKEAKDYDHIIVNDELKESYFKLKEIIKKIVL